MTDLQFTLVAVPFRSQGQAQRKEQFDMLQRAMGIPLRLFMVPELKAGTLDSLLEASDELTKLDPQLEGTAYKLSGILQEVAGYSRAQATQLRINPNAGDFTPEYFLKEFAWNNGQYDPKDRLSALLQKLNHVGTGAEERVRAHVMEYTDTKNKLQAVSRRSQGTLAVRPIGDLVQRWCDSHGLVDGPVKTDFLTTLFVAVPKGHQDEWLATYSSMHEFVVPRSSNVVATDGDFVLNSVVVFQKAADDVKLQCRKAKYTVRDISADDTVGAAEDIPALQSKEREDRDRLMLLLSQQYSLVYVAWIHAKAIRLFVEAMLRFGLPPKFVPVLVAADAKKEASIMAQLSEAYHDYASKFQKSDHHDTGALVHEYPFVALKIANILKPR